MNAPRPPISTCERASFAVSPVAVSNAMSNPFSGGKSSLDESLTSCPPANLPWQERRAQLRSWVEQNPVPRVPLDEVNACFDLMPSHYWQGVSLADLVWGIQSVHGLFEILAKRDTPATTPFLDWKMSPECGVTRVMLCTWDRQGLLAKASGTFSALNINIVRADVCTRADDVVLDLFHISRPKGLKPIDEQVRQEVSFLLAGALSEPPRFASVWAYSRHKYLARAANAPPRISFDIDSDTESTTLSIQASDRLGFLYDALQALADLGLDIQRACINTDGKLAVDQFCFTDATGQKVTEPERLAEIRRRLESALI